MGAGSWEELVQVSIFIIKLETHILLNMKGTQGNLKMCHLLAVALYTG